MVSWLSYLYYRNPHTWKDGLYIETGSRHQCVDMPAVIIPGLPPWISTYTYTAWTNADTWSLLTRCFLEDVADILSISCEIGLRWMPKASLMISQHWFRSWPGAVRRQAITWSNVDQDLCCHMASLGNIGLIGHISIYYHGILIQLLIYFSRKFYICFGLSMLKKKTCLT